MTWNEDEILRKIEQALSDRVEAAGEYLTNRVQANMSIQGSRKDRSKPGEFPRRQTGQTLESVFQEHDAAEIESRVGSLSAVARFLTKGTVKMEPREFLLRTLNEEKPAIIEMIVGDNQQTGAT